MNKHKIRKLFLIALMSGTLMVGLHDKAYAVITDYALKLNNEVYSYNKAQLEQSFLNYKAGKSAKLYEDFHLKLDASKDFYAFKDDKKGYVSYETIKNEFLKSKHDNKSFNIDKFIETEKHENIEIKTVKEISADDRDIVLVKESEAKKDESKSTSSKSSSSSSRRSSSSKKDKEKVENQGKKIENNQDVKKDTVLEKENEKPKKEDVKPVLIEEKEDNVVENKSEKKEDIKKQDIKVENNQDVKKDTVSEKENEKPKKEDNRVVSTEDSFEAHVKEGIKRDIKKAEKPEAIVSKKGNLSINSEITQTAQKPYMGIYQETTILVEGEAKADGVLEILGKKIEIKKGDNYSTVVNKIYSTFKGNEEWNVRYKYGQWGYMGNITFTAKNLIEHIDINIKNENGLTFKVKNEKFGELATNEKKETCTVTVLNDSINYEKIQVKVHSSVINKTFSTFEIEVQKGETKEKIANKIADKLKTDEMIKRFFAIKNNGAQVTIIQKEADALNLSVTINKDENYKDNKKENKDEVVKEDNVVENKSEKKENIKKQDVKAENNQDVKKDTVLEKENEKLKKEDVNPALIEEKEDVKKQDEKKNVKQDIKVENNQDVKKDTVSEKENEKPKKEDNRVVSTEESFEAHVKEGIRRAIEKTEKPEPVVSGKGDLSINSEITQTAQKPYMGVYQETTILVEGEAKSDGILEIEGKKIEIKKGDTYSTVVDKIYSKFKGNEEWNVRYKYGQWGYMGNITFTAKNLIEHIDINIKNENGLTFKVKNEKFGELATNEKKETCTVTVLNDSTNYEKIQVKVHSSVINKTFSTFEIEVQKGETKEKIANKIADKLKTDEMIKRFFAIKNNGAQVTIIQKEADALNLSVTIE